MVVCLGGPLHGSSFPLSCSSYQVELSLSQYWKYTLLCMVVNIWRRQVDLKWLEELKKRRSVDSSPASRGDDGGSAGQREEVELESEPWVQQTLEETNVRAGEM